MRGPGSSSPALPANGRDRAAALRATARPRYRAATVGVAADARFRPGRPRCRRRRTRPRGGRKARGTAPGPGTSCIPRWPRTPLPAPSLCRWKRETIGQDGYSSARNERAGSRPRRACCRSLFRDCVTPNEAAEPKAPAALPFPPSSTESGRWPTGPGLRRRGCPRIPRVGRLRRLAAASRGRALGRARELARPPPLSGRVQRAS